MKGNKKPKRAPIMNNKSIHLPESGDLIEIDLIHNIIEQTLNHKAFNQDYIIEGSRGGFNTNANVYLYIYHDNSLNTHVPLNSKLVVKIKEQNYFYTSFVSKQTRNDVFAPKLLKIHDLFPNKATTELQSIQRDCIQNKLLPMFTSIISNTGLTSDHVALLTNECQMIKNEKHYKKFYAHAGKDKTWVSTESANTSQYDFLALDCEMVTTTKGTELARITVMDKDYNVVLDELVKPGNRIISYNTKWSGLTREIMQGAKIKLSELQKRLVELIGPNTVLAGHSLFNDLNVIKLLHHNIIDTAYLYRIALKEEEHKKGHGTSVSLKALTKAFLGLEIQASRSGHCSKEDTIATILLARFFSEKVDYIVGLMKDFNVLKNSLYKISTRFGDTINQKLNIFATNHKPVDKDDIFSHWNGIIEGNRKVKVFLHSFERKRAKFIKDSKYIYNGECTYDLKKALQAFNEFFEIGEVKNCKNLGVLVSGHLNEHDVKNGMVNYISSLMDKINKNDVVIVVKIMKIGNRNGKVLVVQKN
eukprot:GAHX01002390.1.p1 GENE.GAHX01002390.1~~GAHX01002390.1.p1  ORF type:complete len:531 (+),score=103.64 GAHX01002390.1:73-1665(+)